MKKSISLLSLALLALQKVNATQPSVAKSLLRTYSTINPSLTEVEAAAATAETSHDTSDVEGAAFNRFYVIFLENTDYDKAAEDENLQWLAEQGITLTNYWALTHPSEPNYLAAVGGDYFALNDDRFISMPSNVSNIVDLLDYKDISWGEYQEHMPYSGYQGFNYSNQETYANDYVRKHNPLILFDNIAENNTRLANVKNFTEFNYDVENQKLPQWAFITPNMTNDGHDSTIKVAGQWSRDFLEPLLSNDYFMNDTLVLLTFDENETYSIKNTVFSILLGGSIPDSLKGTSDDTYYDHYSQLSSIQANWDLPSLGRHDVDANVFQLVANATGITNKDVDTTYKMNNETYVGYLLDSEIALPAPNVSATNVIGNGVLPSIKQVWGDEYSSQLSMSYFTSTTTTVSAVLTDANTLVTSESQSSTSNSTVSGTTMTSSSNSTVSTSANGSPAGYKGRVSLASIILMVVAGFL